MKRKNSSSGVREKEITQRKTKMNEEKISKCQSKLVAENLANTAKKYNFINL